MRLHDITDALIEAQPIRLVTTNITAADYQRAEQLCALRRYIASARGYERHPGKERPGDLQNKTHLLGALGELKAGTDLQHILRLTAPLLDTQPSRFDTDDAELTCSDPRHPLRVDIKTTCRDDDTFNVNKEQAEKDEQAGLAGYLVLRTPKNMGQEGEGTWHLIPWEFFKSNRRLHEKPDARGYPSRYYSCTLTCSR